MCLHACVVSRSTIVLPKARMGKVENVGQCIYVQLTNIFFMYMFHSDDIAFTVGAKVLQTGILVAI